MLPRLKALLPGTVGGLMCIVASSVAAPVAATGDVAPRCHAFVGAANSQGGKVRIVVAAVDHDSKHLHFAFRHTTSKGGVVTLLRLRDAESSAVFTYTPTASARHSAAAEGAPAVRGVDAFRVTVSDGEGGSTTVPVKVTIAPANVAPTGSASLSAPNPATGVVTGSVEAFDADGDALAYSSPGTTSKGSVSVSADGTFTYTPTNQSRVAAAQLGAGPTDLTDSFTVTVSDGHGGTVDVPVSATIAPAQIG